MPTYGSMASTGAAPKNYIFIGGNGNQNPGKRPNPQYGYTDFGYKPTNQLDEPYYSWGSRMKDAKSIIEDMRKAAGQGDVEATNRILSGNFDVTPTFSTDPAVRMRTDQIKAEGLQSGQQAGQQYARQYGTSGSGGMGMLASLKGASLGSQGAAEYGLNEAKWRTGVEEGNKQRELESLMAAQQGQLSSRDQRMSGYASAYDAIRGLLDTSLQRRNTKAAYGTGNPIDLGQVGQNLQDYYNQHK